MRRWAPILSIVAACEATPVDVGATLDASAGVTGGGTTTDASATSTSASGGSEAGDETAGGGTAPAPDLGGSETAESGGAPFCDPIAQDCPDLQGCYFADGAFVCLADESGDDDLPGTPCDAPNACAPTMICLDCGGGDCCARVCSVLNPACMRGETCVPFFPVDEAPVGLEDVGTCM
jgi:hypothetical protein